jgi:hypothetical protein
MTNILKALEFVLSSLIIGSAVFFGLESGFHHQYSMSTVNPYAFEYSEIVELKQPESPEVIIPEVRLASFEDEFAVRPVIRNLTEEDWKLLESISIAEAGNQGVEGVALVQLVVINRMEKTGKTARQIIFAPGQFYTRGMHGGNELSAEARELIRCGWDESQGALYFRARHYHSFGTPLFSYKDHYFSI